MSNFPCLVRSVSPSGETRFALGDPLVDRYLAFVAGRARAETLRAMASDLKTFFTVVSKAPVDVVAADVFEFLAHQRGDRSVIRIADRGSGLSARTIARRLSSVSGLFAYLVARGDTSVISNPVPRGLSTGRQGGSKRPKYPVGLSTHTGRRTAVTVLYAEAGLDLSGRRPPLRPLPRCSTPVRRACNGARYRCVSISTEI